MSYRKSSATKSRNASDDDDNLQLRIAPQPTSADSAGFGVSEELVDHLNEQICGLKNECARLYNLLREKDVELKRMKKFQEETETVGINGMTNETVAVKIVDLSKRVRELTAEVESERNRSKQALARVRDLEQLNRQAVSSSKAAVSQSFVEKTPQQISEEKLAADLKIATERARAAESRITELRNQLEESRREARVAIRVLTQEVGDSVDVHALLRQDGPAGWRGRAQQIQTLQKKLADLKANINNNSSNNEGPQKVINTSDMSECDSVVMVGGELSSARQSTATSRHIDSLKRFDKERRQEQERLIAEKQALERDLDDTKQRLMASKARNKTLQEDVKVHKERIDQLMEKSRHDDEFVKVLLKQQETLKQSVISPNSRSSQSADKNKSKSVDSSNASELHQTERIAELEKRISCLQQELQKCHLALCSKSTSDTASISAADCEIVELRGLLQAANMECTRLSETVRTLHADLDKAVKDRLTLEGEMAACRKDHVLLEKHVGKLKLDLEKATGRGGEFAGQRHRTDLSATELEELRAKVDMLTEERSAYRSALEASTQQRKEELSLFESLLDETKRIFSQSVRQIARKSLAAESYTNNTDAVARSATTIVGPELE